MGATTEHVYLRVLDDLRSRIRSGALGPGARVPSRNAIIARYGVGETAAKHALAVLIAEGLIEARPGSGCYVRKAPTAGVLERDRPAFPGSPFGISEPAVPGHARRLTWEHQTEQGPAARDTAARLGLGPGAIVTVTRYLLRADGDPVQLATSYEPAALTAGTPAALPEQGPLAGRGVITRMGSVGVCVDDVVEELILRPSSQDEASALAIPAGAAVFAVERRHCSGRRTVEVADIVIPADRYRLRYRFPAAEAGLPALPPPGEAPAVLAAGAGAGTR